MRQHFVIQAALCAAALCQAQNLSYSLLPSSSVQPSPRVDGTITYDPADRTLYVFGGQDTQPRNDLWSFSLARRQWTEIRPAAPPPPRFGHTMVFDSARRRLIVFGGQASGFFSDVWAFDIQSGSWRQLSVDNTGPSRRYGHSAIYETARDRVVISHGFTSSGRFDDTWAFDLSTNVWRDISPSGPRPIRRCLHHAAYDPERGQMYLYGGCASPVGPCPLGDLWTFDLASNRWTERTAPNGPSPREHYGMAFNSVRSKLILFGGNGGGLLNDTWEYDPRPGTWQRANPEGMLPSPRRRHEAAYASDRGVIFFFGGSTTAGPTSDLWMLGPGFVAPRPVVFPTGVTNAFSGVGGPIAPGEIVSIYGTGLGPVEGVAFMFDPLTGLLPNSGPGVTVTFNEIAAPLLYAQSDQLNVQVPYEIAGVTEARLRVTVNGQPSDPKILALAPTHPGLFPRVWNQDGRVNSPENPASPGSIVVLFATGQGVTIPASRTGGFPIDSYPEPAAPVTLKIGGVPARLVFQGQAPGTAGVMQINARIPDDVPGSSRVPVVLTIGAADSQGPSIAVR